MIVSISQVKLFKACRQAYKFKYIEGLEPVKKAEPLEIGTNYHSKIEDIYNNGYCHISDYSRESAMALVYEKYIYPHFKVKSVEDWFRYDLGNDDILIGRTDGIAEDGYLVEHKTTSIDLTQYEYDLEWDEQILAYMLATGTRKMWYTLIRKPTIRQRANESDEEYFDRMCKWYDEDTDSKVKVLEVTRTDEQIETFKAQLQEVVKAMKEAEPNMLYRNPLHCKCWGKRCEYSSICLNYDPAQEYIEFERRKRDAGYKKA